MPTTHIVILGASFTGLGTTQILLKSLSKSSPSIPFKVTLVSPSTHLYWNIASPRAIIPGKIEDDKMFGDIADGLKQYPIEQFEFRLGTAEALDTEKKTVLVKGVDGNEQVLQFDHLVIATGARAEKGLPFKAVGTTEEQRNLLSDFKNKVDKAKRIVIAGGGVTSVEVAGELGEKYGKEKEIILIASSSTLLPKNPTSLQKYTTQILSGLHVAIHTNTKVLSATPTPDDKQTIQLSDSSTLVTDLYIPIFGLYPNSSFIPASHKKENGYVIVDERLNLVGHKNIWAVGDILDIEYAQVLNSKRQWTYAANAIIAALKGQQTVPYKIPGTRFQGFQIGSKAGTGHWGNWRMPSFLIVAVRKNLFLDKMAEALSGAI